MRTGRIHYAKLENSPRLQKLLAYLRDRKPHTTREIGRGVDIMAVNTAVDELRFNGYEIDCQCVRRGIYQYILRGKKRFKETLFEVN